MQVVVRRPKSLRKPSNPPPGMVFLPLLLGAYSGRIRPLIPVESVHLLRMKSTTVCGDSRPPIPAQIDRLES